VPSLRVISGPLAGEQIEVERKLTIGRHDADVVIDDPELSRRHLEISLDGEALIVEDLGSTNGTVVDGHVIDGPTHVGDGARVKLGSTLLEVQIPEAAQATRLSQTPDLEATRLRRIPTEVPPVEEAPGPANLDPPQPASPAPAAASAPASHPPAVADAPALASSQALTPPAPEAFGAFSPPTSRRGAGLASRSWVPVALSFGTVILTALALVIYFAQR
jgi:pSer/pThr/pTyr-binding forkhead associated (FHA) protein